MHKRSQTYLVTLDQRVISISVSARFRTLCSSLNLTWPATSGSNSSTVAYKSISTPPSPAIMSNFSRRRNYNAERKQDGDCYSRHVLGLQGLLGRWNAWCILRDRREYSFSCVEVQFSALRNLKSARFGKLEVKMILTEALVALQERWRPKNICVGLPAE